MLLQRDARRVGPTLGEEVHRKLALVGIPRRLPRLGAEQYVGVESDLLALAKEEDEATVLDCRDAQRHLGHCERDESGAREFHYVGLRHRLREPVRDRLQGGGSVGELPLALLVASVGRMVGDPHHAVGSGVKDGVDAVLDSPHALLQDAPDVDDIPRLLHPCREVLLVLLRGLLAFWRELVATVEVDVVPVRLDVALAKGSSGQMTAVAHIEDGGVEDAAVLQRRTGIVEGADDAPRVLAGRQTIGRADDLDGVLTLRVAAEDEGRGLREVDVLAVGVKDAARVGVLKVVVDLQVDGAQASREVRRDAPHVSDYGIVSTTLGWRHVLVAILADGVREVTDGGLDLGGLASRGRGPLQRLSGHAAGPHLVSDFGHGVDVVLVVQTESVADRRPETTHPGRPRHLVLLVSCTRLEGRNGTPAHLVLRLLDGRHARDLGDERLGVEKRLPVFHGARLVAAKLQQRHSLLGGGVAAGEGEVRGGQVADIRSREDRCDFLALLLPFRRDEGGVVTP